MFRQQINDALYGRGRIAGAMVAGAAFPAFVFTWTRSCSAQHPFQFIATAAGTAGACVFAGWLASK